MVKLKSSPDSTEEIFHLPKMKQILSCIAEIRYNRTALK
jgi:hypothetical protein